MWFGQPCLRPRMRENDSTIQQRILQRTEPDTTIRFPKHPMFPHSLYPYLTTSPLAPPGTSRSSSHFYPPRIVSIGPSPSHDFGCKTFVHVLIEQRFKLNDKAILHVFVRYGDEEFGFKLWDPTKKKLVKSGDVVFQEDQTLGDFDKPNQSKNSLSQYLFLYQQSNPKMKMRKWMNYQQMIVQVTYMHKSQLSIRSRGSRRISQPRLGGLQESIVPLLDIHLLSTCQ